MNAMKLALILALYIMFASSASHIQRSFSTMILMHNETSYTIFQGAMDYSPKTDASAEVLDNINWCVFNCRECMCRKDNYNAECGGCCYECASCEQYYWHCEYDLGDECAQFYNSYQSRTSQIDRNANAANIQQTIQVNHYCNCSNEATQGVNETHRMQFNSSVESETHSANATSASDFNVDLSIPVAAYAYKHLNYTPPALDYYRQKLVSYSYDANMACFHNCLSLYTPCLRFNLELICDVKCNDSESDVKMCMECIADVFDACTTQAYHCMSSCYMHENMRVKV